MSKPRFAAMMSAFGLVAIGLGVPVHADPADPDNAFHGVLDTGDDTIALWSNGISDSGDTGRPAGYPNSKSSARKGVRMC